LLLPLPLIHLSCCFQVTLFLRGRNVSLPLYRLPLRKSGTLSVCVPPIYWYYFNIIFFLETWKEQGASHVYMYYHSSSRSVLQVLRHYEQQGFVTMVPWPSLPRSQLEDPNKSVYRLAHSLAHNDCVLRIESEFGALVDIDEIIVPRSGTLLPFIVEKFSNATIAGDKFSFVDLDFSGILNATESQVNGPSKARMIFIAIFHSTVIA
uniref:Glycosyltransferase family 92 protein n=1 Tax=Nippostrongylus brasiliensis TaxID=27835 RepID=A0A0N4XCM0_NIPBR